MNGVSQHTLNLVLAAWELYSLVDELVSSGKTCLGLMTNNLTKSHGVIGLLTDALSNDVSHVVVYLYLELEIS